MTRGYCLDSLRQLTLLKPDATITNYEFVQCLKQMRLWKDTNHIVPTAFNLYGKINEKKNHYSIRTLLKLCSSSTVRVSPCQIKMIWEDILHTNNVQNISQTAIVKCVSNTMKHRQSTKDIEVCIHILQSLLANHEHSTSNRTIYCALIHAYGLCSDIDNAHDAFRSLSIGDQMDSISVSAMMTALIKNQKYKNALALYEEYRALQDDVMHLLAIKACIKTSDFKYGKEVIATNIGNDEAHSVKLYSALIDLYGACHDVDAAEAIYRCIPSDERDIVSMCSMMTCYLKNNANDECLRIYAAQSNDRSKNNVSHLLALKACTKGNKYEVATQIIHKHIDYRTTKHSIELLTTMIDLYGECGDIERAKDVFLSVATSERSVVCNGAMMKALIKAGMNDEALAVYKQARQSHNNTTHLLALKACINLGDFEYGEEIIKNNRLYVMHLESDANTKINLCNTMMEFYGKMGDIARAMQLFDAICAAHKDDIVSATVMMNAYCDAQMNGECIELFRTIVSDPRYAVNYIAVSTVLKAAIHESALQFGQYIESSCDEHILNHLDVQLNLICLYGKCNKLSLCHQIFETIRMNQRSKYESEIKLWNAMINAYARNGKVEKIVQLLERMSEETSLIPNARTYCVLLNACNHSDQRAQHLLHDICNKYIDDDKPFTLPSIEDMSGKESLDTLDVFLLCLRIKYDKHKTESDILSALPVYQLKYDHMDSFREIMRRVESNNETQNNEYIHQLMDALKRKSTKLNTNECLSVINGYGLMGNTSGMMKEYKHMLSCGLRLDSDVLICLLHHLIRDGEPQYVSDIWNDIRGAKNIRVNALALQSLILCVNRSRHCHSNEILREMWHLVVDEGHITPNIHCYCLMTWSLSKYAHNIDNKQMAARLLNDFERNHAMQSLLATNHLQFIQMLNSYGNIGELQKMWSFYHQYIEKWKNNQHDMDALVALCSHNFRLNDVLQIVEDSFNLSHDLSIDALIVFHRIAIKTENHSMERKISAVLQEKNKTHKIKTNVLSYFAMDGESYCISTGYAAGGCSFNSHDKVDALMKEIGFEMNTSECTHTELTCDIAKIKHLKSHSEKKALAIVLDTHAADQSKDIKIKVSMKMCVDCHDFFCQVSAYKKYQRFTIQCVDPKGVHLFKNGICHLCNI
eukprot:260361_1